MIDLNGFLDELYHEIKDYTDVEQLILGTEDIPPDLMEFPRIRMAFTTRYNPEARQSMVKITHIVESDEDDFDEDIEFEYITNPTATLSINAYGEVVDEYIGKAREWFQIHELGARFLKQHRCVISDIMETEDRHTMMETEYEDRQGFDVELSFEDRIKVIEKTIEKVEINNGFNDESYEIDL